MRYFHKTDYYFHENTHTHGRYYDKENWLIKKRVKRYTLYHTYDMRCEGKS